MFIFKFIFLIFIAITLNSCIKQHPSLMYDLEFINATNEDLWVYPAKDSTGGFGCGFLSGNGAYSKASTGLTQKLRQPLILEITKDVNVNYEKKQKWYITVPVIEHYHCKTITIKITSLEKVEVSMEEKPYYINTYK